MKFENKLGSSNQYYFFLTLSVTTCILFVSFIVSAFASHFDKYTNKARVTEALTLITTIKSEISSEYTLLGYWPNSREFSNLSSNIIEKVVFDGKGAINIYFNDNQPKLKNTILSFTAATYPEYSLSNILWICGYAKPPENFKRIGANITNLGRELLPRSCKF